MVAFATLPPDERLPSVAVPLPEPELAPEPLPGALIKLLFMTAVELPRALPPVPTTAPLVLPALMPVMVLSSIVALAVPPPVLPFPFPAVAPLIVLSEQFR